MADGKHWGRDSVQVKMTAKKCVYSRGGGRLVVVDINKGPPFGGYHTYHSTVETNFDIGHCLFNS